MSNLDKSSKIKQTMTENRVRRASMSLKVYELKIDESHLSKTVKAALDFTFIQAKWLYNNMLADSSFFPRSDKDRSVTVLKFNPETQKCDIPEVRQLTLGSQVLQSLIERGKQNIVNLAKAKTKGLKTGALNFASEVNSIPLKQFGSTHKFVGGKYLRLQGIGKVKVSGIEQLAKTEPASAVLIKNSLGYFIKIVCYKNKTEQKLKGSVGLDFGIKDSIVTSDGEKFNFNFPIPKELKNKQKKLSKKTKGGKNYIKQLQRVKKSYAKLTNKKNDAANKFVHGLKKIRKSNFSR
jgi:putative transposase